MTRAGDKGRGAIDAGGGEATPVSKPVDPGGRVVRVAERLARAISATLFAALFVTFVAQVFWRYVLRDPLVWTLDVAGVLFVAVSLFTAATQMPLREHVGLGLAVDRLPDRARRLARTLSLTLFAAVMLLSMPDTVAVLEWMFRERTQAIRFNFGYLFMLMIVFVTIDALRALWDVAQLWRRR